MGLRNVKCFDWSHHMVAIKATTVLTMPIEWKKWEIEWVCYGCIYIHLEIPFNIYDINIIQILFKIYANFILLKRCKHTLKE